MNEASGQKVYQKLLKKGNGSILKALRTGGGAGIGLIVGGILFVLLALLSFALPLAAGEDYLFIALIMGGSFGIPGLLLLGIGILLNHRRVTGWINYYLEATGYTEEEILEIDRELASPSVELVMTRLSGTTAVDIACFLTPHCIVTNTIAPYMRKYEDLIAVAYSDITEPACMVCLSRQDEETMAALRPAGSRDKKELIEKVMTELCRRNPAILRGQSIVCNGRRYILDRDGAELLRLHNDGCTLECGE